MFVTYLLCDVGNWKDQLGHIYAHLLNQCSVDSEFRNKIGQPKLGKVSMH